MATSASIPTGSNGASPAADRYKWIALSNVTLGVLLAVLDGSIVLIAMPSIFRGIHLDPLVPANSFYLLWMILGFLVVTSVLIVSLGRLGDMYGRVKMYNFGFLVYTVASLFLTIDWMTGRDGALYLIVFRIVQGIGAAFLLANSAAILTDAFPANQRGMALGINNIVGVSGVFIGLVLGGLLAPIDWRAVFLISVPIGVFGTVWAYLKLEERSTPKRASVDWWGNLTFALGLILIMVSVTYGIRPYGGHATGWTSPKVIALLGAGVVSLVTFALIEWRVEDPMFRLPLFRIRAFTFGTLSTFLSAVARGGLMFMLIIWLQGIWLPQHGYDFSETPLWAGIYMLPLIVGMLVAGPTSGYLSDRFGARWFATGGMLGAALSFFMLALLPIDFPYPLFAAILFLNGISMGMFASPNRAAVMNSLPAGDRGAGGGMNQTFQNSAQVLSIGIFFTLMIFGLSSSLPSALTAGLKAHGVAAATAAGVAHLPPVSILFAAFLGYNPIQHLVGAHALSALSPANRATLVGHSFFPHLISAPFRAGLHEAFAFAIVACLIAAGASLMRGGRYHHGSSETTGGADGVQAGVPLNGASAANGATTSNGASTIIQPPSERNNMQIEWYGQSAFRLTAGDTTVAIDPFGDMSPMAASRGMQFDYPPIDGVEADLLLVTHEHMDHNGVEVVGGDPAILRSTAGKLESPIGEVTAIASEHDEAAGTERGPNTIFVFELDGLRVCHFGDFGQSALRDEQAEAIGRVDLLIVPVGGGPTAGARQAAAIVERLQPRWVVPMHYRTPRIGFLETADSFLELYPDVHRLEDAVFETGELPGAEGPLVVVPAAP